MNSLIRIVAIVMLPMFAAPFSAVSEKAAQPRIAWQGDDLAPKKTVKWVYEGCAAYPVTDEEASTASLESRTGTDRPDRHSQAIATVGSSDMAK